LRWPRRGERRDPPRGWTRCSARPAGRTSARPRLAGPGAGGYNTTWTDDGGAGHSLSLNVVNRAFGQDGWAIEQAYLRRIGRAFGAGLALVDYVRDAGAARDTINGWVARQTADRIPTLLGPTDVTASTRLILVNAIYMKASWAREFDVDHTRDRAFLAAGGGTLSVPTMTSRRAGRPARDRARSAGDAPRVPRRRRVDAPDDDAHPARRPRRLRGLVHDSKLAAIDAQSRRGPQQAKTRDIDYGDMTCQTYPYNVRLFLPKFGVDTRMRLVPTLRAMGMGPALDPSVPTSPHHGATRCGSQTSSTRRTSTLT